MGMAMVSKWIKSFFTSGKKSKEKEKGKNGISKPTSIPTENPPTPIIIPPTNLKEKRRWSFRRSSATGTTTKDLNSATTVATNGSAVHISDASMEAGVEAEQNHNMATAVTVIHQTNAAVGAAFAPPISTGVEEVAAIKIQAAFRCHLAKRALCALKGIVKLQALVRGQLMRRRATAILQCMQALVSVQKRAQAQRLRGAREAQPSNLRQSIHRKFSKEIRFTQVCDETGTDLDANIEMVEIDLGQPRESSKSRNSYSTHPQERIDPRYSEYYPSNCANSKQDHLHVTRTSSKANSDHFEDDLFSNALGSPQYHSTVSKLDPTRTPLVVFPHNDGAASVSTDDQFHPRYMGNTKSSRAKVRSHSAPKQRSESYERQTSNRRSTMEGNNSPRMRMQRSSSHVGSYRYPSSIKLDRSSVSLQDSECGSTSTVLTNASYCRSLATPTYEVSVKF